MTNNTQQETDFTLRTDFQHDDNSTPPSGTLRSDAIRGIVITAIAAVVAFVLNNILPFEPLTNKGLALAAFIGILWLTEAIHVTATAILVPLLHYSLAFQSLIPKKPCQALPIRLFLFSLVALRWLPPCMSKNWIVRLLLASSVWLAVIWVAL